MRIFTVLSILLPLLPVRSVKQSDDQHKELIIFHAGSLSLPLKQVTLEYEKRNPGTKIFLNHPNLDCARKVTELKKPCDIVASSDYFVINELLIPDYATWRLGFATNEIVIAYQVA